MTLNCNRFQVSSFHVGGWVWRLRKYRSDCFLPPSVSPDMTWTFWPPSPVFRCPRLPCLPSGAASRTSTMSSCGTSGRRSRASSSTTAGPWSVSFPWHSTLIMVAFTCIPLMCFFRASVCVSSPLPASRASCCVAAICSPRSTSPGRHLARTTGADTQLCGWRTNCYVIHTHMYTKYFMCHRICRYEAFSGGRTTMQTFQAGQRVTLAWRHTKRQSSLIICL